MSLDRRAAHSAVARQDDPPALITRQAIRRGTFTGVAELETAIRTYIDSYNERATPFTWTKTADELLGKIKRKSINNTRH